METNNNNPEAQERVPLLDSQRKTDEEIPELSPQTITRIISRLRAMMMRLLPIEVDREELFAPTTKPVVQAFKKAGGDFDEAVPYCLLEACRAFYFEAQHDPANFDEHMSARYRRIESDGDVSLPLSAIELAADFSCSYFLSSEVCQRITFALWKGHLVQDWDSHGHTIFKINPVATQGGFLAHFSPSRITAVPRWQNWLRILLWLLFLITYSLALQTPDKAFGPEDVIFYIQVAGYVEEEVVRLWKIGPKAAIGFWTVVNYLIYAIAISAFVLRILDVTERHDEDLALQYRRYSFYMLSMAAPLIWMKLLTVFDSYSFFGVMQIVVFRMMRETAIFFTLLTLLAFGFAQALLGLDNSDQTGSDSKVGVVRALAEGLLGSPAFDMFVPDGGFIVYPFGLIQYYLWTAATGVILLNVLVALFGTAYDSIVGDAANQYLVFFTGKVISLILLTRSDSPFNLIELAIIPLELVISKEAYKKLNSFIMTIVFCPVVCAVALYEGHFETPRVREAVALLEEVDEDFEEDPETDESDKARGTISKESFEDLVKVFPDLEYSPMTNILNELKTMKEQLTQLENQLKK